MATVKGVKEKLHMPIYDAFLVPGARNGTPPRTFKDVMTDPRVIRFFVDVQSKTKLETNLQAAGVLPSLNTFEARAMRVVTSTCSVPRAALTTASIYQEIVAAANTYITSGALAPLVQKIRDALEAAPGQSYVFGPQTESAIQAAAELYKAQAVTAAGATPEQKDRLVNRILEVLDAGCAEVCTILPELIYNSVTTLLVGEKIMIEVPTFYFPSGAGVSPGNGTAANHGNPDPMATFRFSEPVTIEPQQNFRVEMAFPQGVPGQQGVPGNLANVSGPMRIWVILDGYLTRDVQ